MVVAVPLIDMVEVESGQIPLVVDVRPAELWKQDQVTGSLSLPVTTTEKEEVGGQTELVSTVCRLLGPRLPDPSWWLVGRTPDPPAWPPSCSSWPAGGPPSSVAASRPTGTRSWCGNILILAHCKHKLCRALLDNTAQAKYRIFHKPAQA